MKSIPSSHYFRALAWKLEMPQWPTLEGCWLLPDSRNVEIALVGEQEMPMSWRVFLERVEVTAEVLLLAETRLLRDSCKRIASKHKQYFPGRWTAGSEALLHELSLRLVCFYVDGTAHLWYRGSDVFNHLDVDIGLDADLRVTEVRFDG